MNINVIGMIYLLRVLGVLEVIIWVTESKNVNSGMFHYSNLGPVQQVKAVGKDMMTQALQKRLQDIGNTFLITPIEFRQLDSKSGKRIDDEYKEAYQNHLKELKEHRKHYIPDKKLIQFNSRKNPDLYFGASRSNSRPKVSLPKEPVPREPKRPSLKIASRYASNSNKRVKASKYLKIFPNVNFYSFTR
jgi:hypothetical protein